VTTVMHFGSIQTEQRFLVGWTFQAKLKLGF